MLLSYNPKQMSKEELNEVSVSLENYLRDNQGKILDTLSGKKIQYLKHYESNDESPVEFRDEVVYVETRTNKEGSKVVSYVGMNWKDSAITRRLVVKDLSPEVIANVVVSSKASEAARTYKASIRRTRK